MGLLDEIVIPESESDWDEKSLQREIDKLVNYVVQKEDREATSYLKMVTFEGLFRAHGFGPRLVDAMKAVEAASEAERIDSLNPPQRIREAHETFERRMYTAMFGHIREIN